MPSAWTGRATSSSGMVSRWTSSRRRRRSTAARFPGPRAVGRPHRDRHVGDGVPQDSRADRERDAPAPRADLCRRLAEPRRLSAREISRTRLEQTDRLARRARAGHGAQVAPRERVAVGVGDAQLRRRRPVRRSCTITGSLPRPNTHSSDHSRSAVSTGRSASPFSVSRYSKCSPSLPTSTRSKISCSTRCCRRAERTFFAMPRLRSKSPKRRAPKNASRTISSVHQSPNASSAWPIPQFMSANRLRPMTRSLHEIVVA